MRRLSWQVGKVAAVRDETATARTLTIDVPDWPGHRAGQHVDLRLTAEDGYSTERSYSIGSAARPGPFDLTVQTVPDGEVSPYLTQEVQVGDLLELRGPIGGWFVWRPDESQPVLLLAGGSGVVPLMSMVRSRAGAGSTTPFVLVYSVRTPDDLLYGDELSALSGPDSGLSLCLAFTRTAPARAPRPPHRLTGADVPRPEPVRGTAVFICGPTGFVEAAARLAQDAGHPAAAIRAERFGPQSPQGGTS